MTDGLSNTAMICETWGRDGFGYQSRGMNLHNVVYFDSTPNSERSIWKANASTTCQRTLADGSVRFVGDSIDGQLFAGLATRAGGEILGEF